MYVRYLWRKRNIFIYDLLNDNRMGTNWIFQSTETTGEKYCPHPNFFSGRILSIFSPDDKIGQASFILLSTTELFFFTQSHINLDISGEAIKATQPLKRDNAFQGKKFQRIILVALRRAYANGSSSILKMFITLVGKKTVAEASSCIQNSF